MANNPYQDLDAEEGRPIDPPVAPQPLAGDRGEPTTKSPKRKSKGVVIAVVAIIVAALLCLGFVGMFAYRSVQASKAAKAANVAEDPALAQKTSDGPDLGRYQEKLAADLAAQQKAAEDQRLALEKQAELARLNASRQGVQQAVPGQPSLGRYEGAQRGQAPQQGNGGGTAKREPTPAEVAAARRLNGSVLWADNNAASGRGGSGSNARAAGGNAGASSLDGQEVDSSYLPGSDSGGSFTGASLGGGGAAGGAGGSAGGKASIGGMLQTERYPNGTVQQRGSVKYLLARGTTIPCTMRERVVTNYPGGVMCIINRDVYSADGSVLLMGKGSTVNGERKVAMSAGVAKVFVAWGDVETTDHAHVQFDSLAADALGGAGLDAWLDRHLMERFGGAILLSFADDVFKALSNSTSSSEVSFDSSTSNGSDMASIALENSINIPNTGYVKQAAETNILVARDVDFTRVYGVQ
jgi:type IV secretion system protein VirB10